MFVPTWRPVESEPAPVVPQIEPQIEPPREPVQITDNPALAMTSMSCVSPEDLHQAPIDGP